MKFATAILCLGLGVAAHRFNTVDWIDNTIAHTGKPVGKEIEYKDLTLYVSKPHHGQTNKIAVLYLTDVFGINLTESKLLADSFARAGFFTVAPDLFDGEPAPADLNVPDFPLDEFLAAHNTTVTDPKIVKAIKYIKKQHPSYKIAITGYCFGGRYAFRFLAKGKGGDVAFTAHPSFTLDDEVSAITRPISVAAADHDDILTVPKRRKIEDLLLDGGKTYQTSIYSGTMHGFGVRANISDPEQKFGKETAFLQAVHWFNSWA